MDELQDIETRLTAVESKMKRIDAKLKHKQTAVLLVICAYVVAMAFFALVRAFGLLWFQAEYVQTTLPLWAEYIIMFFYSAFEAAVMFCILTDFKWQRAALLGAAYSAICFIPLSSTGFFILDIGVTIIIPFAANKDKRRSIGSSILYMLGIWIYQGLMMMGRGYPLLSKFNTVYQILGTLDYKLFLLFILSMKGVAIMRPGCMFFFGKFDNAAQKIGHVILMPFSRLMKHDN